MQAGHKFTTKLIEPKARGLVNQKCGAMLIRRPKFAFYYFNSNRDIGHAVHLLRIVSGLRGRGAYKSDLLIFCSEAAGYPFEDLRRLTRVVVLPPFKKEFLKKRQAVMRSELIGLGPCRLITEFFPFGRLECTPEISELLAYAREKKIKTAASVPLPYFTHPSSRLGELFEAAVFYDKILVHCPKGADLRFMARHIAREHRISSEEFLRTFLKLGEKVVFTGYVLPPRHKKIKPRPGRFILVQRGGGSTSPRIITCAIRAKKLLGAGVEIKICAGPASDAEQMRYWAALIKKLGLKNISLEKSAPDLFSLIGSSTVSVGTAGGSVYEMLYFNKPAVLIPYTGSPGREHSDQSARAELLRYYCGAAVMDYGALTPERLALEIQRALLRRGRTNKSVPGEWFNGLENTLNYLLPCKK